MKKREACRKAIKEGPIWCTVELYTSHTAWLCIAPNVKDRVLNGWGIIRGIKLCGPGFSAGKGRPRSALHELSTERGPGRGGSKSSMTRGPSAQSWAVTDVEPWYRHHLITP